MPGSSIRQILSKIDKKHLADCETLWCKILSQNPAWLLAHKDFAPSTDNIKKFNSLAARLRQGEPLAYLLGTANFYGLEITVNPNVLIPRPETELLVDTALGLPLADNASVVDLGCGSGAIACAIAHKLKKTQVIAADFHLPSLLVTASNAAKLGLSKRIQCLHCNWWQGLETIQPDLVITNPPYIAPDDPQLAESVLKYEPSHALFASDNGLQAYDRIIDGWKRYAPQAKLVGEHGYQQGNALEQLALTKGARVLSRIKDYAGLDRIIILG